MTGDESAEASEHTPEAVYAVFIGGEVTVAETELTRRGGRLGVVCQPRPWGGLGLWIAGYPVLGETDISASSRDLIARGIVAPTLSRVIARSDLVGEISPVRTANDRSSTALRLLGGLGGSYTRDEETYALAEYRGSFGEWSPTYSVGMAVDSWRGNIGAQIHGTWSLHRESGPWGEPAVWDLSMWVGLDLGFRLSRPSEAK